MLKAYPALGAVECQIQRDQQAAQQAAQQILTKAQEQAEETKEAAIRAATAAELSKLESNLLHNDALEECGEELQNHLTDFDNEPLAMDAPPLGLQVPLHQSYVQPTILPTQTLPSRPCPSPEPRPFVPSAAREFLSSLLPLVTYYEPSTIRPQHISSFKHRIAASYLYWQPKTSEVLAKHKPKAMLPN